MATMNVDYSEEQSARRRRRKLPTYVFLLSALLSSADCVWAGNAYPANPNVTGGAIFVAQQHGVTRFDTGRLQPLWSARADSSDDATVVTVQAVLVGSSHGLTAFDPATGSLLWHLASDARLFSPSVADGVAYVGSKNGILRAVQVENGRVLWQRRFNGWVYAPAIVGERLIVGGQSQRLYALDRANGQLLWDIPLSQEMVYRPVAVEFAGSDIVVVTLFSGEIIALHAADGRLHWRAREDVASLSPVSANGRLYFRTMGGPLKVRSAADGRLLWQSRQALSSHPIRVVTGRVIARDDSGKIVVLNAFDGTVLWQRSTHGQSIGSPILLADDRLVLFTDSPGASRLARPNVFPLLTAVEKEEIP